MTISRPSLVRRWFLGVPFTPLSIEQAVAWIHARPASAPFGFVTTPNAQHVVDTTNRPDLYSAIHRSAALVLNDSAILERLARRWFKFPLPQAAGSDLIAKLLDEALEADDDITIIGGTQETENRLRARYGIRRIARHDPPMGYRDNPAEICKCADFILANPARYVLIVTSWPQSELVAMAVLERGGATGTALCVGSGLDAAVGIVRRAPRFVRRAGLEWAYRLARHPIRHAKRVFVQSAPILLVAARARRCPDLHGPSATTMRS